jgi:hypothetical protein
MLQKPLSTGYIEQQLSFLRALCNWTNKPGLVRSSKYYLRASAPPAGGSQTASESFVSGSPPDFEAMLSKLSQKDQVVALQFEVQFAFGLKRSEAVVFCPTLALVPPHALPAGANEGDYLAFVHAKRGTRGARVRLTPIRSEAQRAVFERAKTAAPGLGMHIGRPNQSIEQAKAHFSNELYRCRVSLRALDVPANSERPEFAGDLHFELSTIPPLPKGSPLGADRVVMEAVYLEIARRISRGQQKR